MTRIALLIFGLMFSAPALACTPITGPTIIGVPGSYCLTNHIYVTTPGQNGISVLVSNVTINLNAFAIVGPSTGAGAGIQAIGKNNIRVFAGNVRGFKYGIDIEYSSNSYVGYVDASDNLLRGIVVLGPNAIIEYSRVKNIPGMAAHPDSHSIGVEAFGPNCHIRFNSIENIMPYGAGEGVGASVSDNPAGCMVYDNLIRFSQKPATGRTFGVWTGGGAYPQSVHNNVILGADYGLFGYLATGNSFGNHAHQRCPTFWTAPNFNANNQIEYGSGCTDPEAGF